jgi:hypothetical protein
MEAPLGALERIAETDTDKNLYMVAANMQLPVLFRFNQLVAIFTEGLRASGADISPEDAIAALGVDPAREVALRLMLDALKMPEGKDLGNVVTPNAGASE